MNIKILSFCFIFILCLSVTCQYNHFEIHWPIYMKYKCVVIFRNKEKITKSLRLKMPMMISFLFFFFSFILISLTWTITIASRQFAFDTMNYISIHFAGFFLALTLLKISKSVAFHWKKKFFFLLHCARMRLLYVFAWLSMLCVVCIHIIYTHMHTHRPPKWKFQLNSSEPIYRQSKYT